MICSDCGDSEVKDCAVTSETKNSCTQQGTIEYTASCDFQGTPYSEKKTETIEATGHTYGNPQFAWNKAADGSYTCVATFSCEKGDDTQTENCTVTSVTSKVATCTQEGTIEYTASCEFQGKSCTTNQLKSNFCKLQ